ncbi:Cellulase (glycosyl hydrolase family 5) [Rhizobium sp. NFR07]|uniref:glycoside hydrolase family 5 protein n=1 Tax=Rhizobium sp. NFR07 TaxID=1566262 RepID=UPI0008EE2213|nr:cellulase family glycosylhydrolase [Rhizobium sp. NFR07]SFA80500.1 Cellulase (glycosyl hydrolase family 5) [Rhizobium sp. NFR07]
MRYWYKAVLALLLAGLTMAPHVSQAADTPTFRRGINLARLHSLPTEDPSKPGAFAWPPFQGPLAQITDAELVRLRELGFDFIRLPVAPAPFLTETESRRQALFDDLFGTVRRLQGAGFGVLLDAHPNHTDENWSAPAILSKADGSAFKQYAAWLKKLARFLRNRPSEKTALGLMNEPQDECHIPGAGDWTRMQPRLHAAVRATAPDLAIVVTTGCWSSPDALHHLDMSIYDDKTLVDVHYYRPHAFTHQGLPFANTPTRYLSGLAYPGQGADTNLTMFRSMQLIKQRQKDGADVPADAMKQVKDAVADYYDNPPIVDQTYIPSHFAAMRQWTKEQKVDPARLIIGEFGAARPPKGMPENPGRTLWLEHVRKAAEANGFGWAMWDYNAGDGYPGFGLVFDNESRKIDPDVVDALGLDPKGLRR